MSLAAQEPIRSTEPIRSAAGIRITRLTGLVLGVAFVVAIGWLARLDQGGPAHSSLVLSSGEPATLYLPGPENPFLTLFPPPPSERPAAVVLIHGFLCDRQMMSVLARRMAQNGYAVLAIDVQGHGENRNPLRGGEFVTSNLRDDVQEAVDYLRQHPLVDGSRLAVMGHSMGAGATLDFATHDPNLGAAVMISGGWGLGPERPKNALFIFAQRDPEEEIQQTSAALAAHLAGVEQIDLNQTYGDFRQGTAVEAVRVPDVDHLQIVYSADAATIIVKWLDRAFGTTRTRDVDVADPRLTASGIALAIFVVLLVPLGRLCGSIAPQWPERLAGVNPVVGLLIVAGALIAAMPLAVIIAPASFVAMVIGDAQFSWFAVAGLLLVIALTLSPARGRVRLRDRFGTTLLAAALGFAVVYVCQIPMSVTFHRMSLSPERLIVMVVGTLLLLPFWMGFELLVRRGSVPRSTALALVGRASILVLIAVGVGLHMVPPAMMLVLPSLTILMLMVEIFAASAYSTSRNLALIALVEAAWLSWSIAATNPVTFML